MDFVVLVLPVLDGCHIERGPVGEDQPVRGLGIKTFFGGGPQNLRGSSNLGEGPRSSPKFFGNFFGNFWVGFGDSPGGGKGDFGVEKGDFCGVLWGES